MLVPTILTSSVRPEVKKKQKSGLVVEYLFGLEYIYRPTKRPTPYIQKLQGHSLHKKF